MTRRQTLACPSDPAGAPSGMRWRPVFGGDVWLLRGADRHGFPTWLGTVARMMDGRFAIGRTTVVPSRRGRRWKRIRGAARALVREVRRG